MLYLFTHEERFELTIATGSISGLASQATARTGNLLGILGVMSGILTSLAAVGFSPEVLAQFGGIAAIGGIVGKFMAQKHRILRQSVLSRA